MHNYAGGVELNIEEEWRDIKGYKGVYQISNLGKVRSLDRMSIQNHFLEGKILKGCDNGNGYWYFDLYSEGKRKKKSGHVLVAEAFISNPNNYPCVNHKDEDTYNNRVDNLEWCTYKYNCNYGSHNKNLSKSLKGKNSGKDNVTSKPVVCVTTGKVFDTITDASKYYNIEKSRSHISAFCNKRKNFNYIGKLEDGTKLTWMYYDEYLENLE